MGVPAVLSQPPAYPPPGAPERFQDRLARGPQPPPGTLNIDDFVPAGAPTAVQRNVVVDVGDGVHLRGQVAGSRFRVGFTSGDQPFLIDRFGFARDIGVSGYCYRGGRRYGYGAGYPLYYGYSDDYYYGPVYGRTVLVDPDPFVTGASPQPAIPAPPAPPLDETRLPALERGHLALEREQPADAVNFYRAHLAVQPSDGEAMRWLAVALQSSGQPATGVAMMALAYQTDPSLAVVPMAATHFPEADEGVRQRFLAAVAYANSAKGSSAYLTAAVLAQAEGRVDVARRLVARAKAAGHDRAVIRELEAALAKK